MSDKTSETICYFALNLKIISNDYRIISLFEISDKKNFKKDKKSKFRLFIFVHETKTG